MHRVMLFAAAAALILTGAADAAQRKKPRVSAERAVTATKYPRQHVARPAAVPLNQQWPTSWSDGSFSYRGN
jgi:hypothetical protein